MRFSALRISWYKIIFYACRRWWTCSPRSAAAGIRGNTAMNDLSNIPQRTGGRRSGIWVLSAAALLLIALRALLPKPADAAANKAAAAIAVDTATVAHADI